MPRKQKQKQKQTQRQSVVVNIGEAPKRKAAARRRRPRAPRQTIEEAEYIAALNRTMPAVQINPPPATQVPLLSQEQAVGLIQSALAMRPPSEISIAQREVRQREAASQTAPRPEMKESEAQTRLTVKSKPAIVDIPAHSTFSFKDTPAVVPQGEPAVDRAIIPLEAGPRFKETTVVSEPASDNIHMNALAAPNADKMSRPEAGFPKPTLPESGDLVPIMRRDPDYAFNAVTTGVKRTIPVPKERATSPRPVAARKNVSVVQRLSDIYGLSTDQAKERYNADIAGLMAEGKTKKQAQDIMTKRYKYQEAKDVRMERSGMVSRLKSRPASVQTEKQKEIIYVNL